MKTLFVQGHNTQGSKLYKRFTDFFSKEDVTYFAYGLNEYIDDVYLAMCELIKKHKYDCLIGHSMGGYFVSRYILEHGASKFKKVIFMMPLLCKVTMIDLLSKIPLIDKVVVPKGLIYPANSLSNDKSILSDPNLLKPIPLKQIVDIYKQLLSDYSIIGLLNKNKNCVLIYANNDTFTPITNDTLRLIKRKRIVPGQHECFNENLNKTEFFRVLKQVMDSDYADQYL